MMNFQLSILLVAVSALSTYGFHFTGKTSILRTTKTLRMSDVSDITTSPDYKTVALSGFVNKATDYAEPFVFSKLFENRKWTGITTITDDEKFAKKRLVTPKTVYSGLIDVLTYAEVNSNEALSETLAGKDAWLSYNVTPADLEEYAKIAAKAGLKRAVFGVSVTPAEAGADTTFEPACKILADAGVAYTIVKYGGVTKMGEAKFPYRIVRGVLALPTEGDLLASSDLLRVLVEVVDIPKTFNNVYGIGPGTRLDSEILVYMKSQGWPERVQVGLLVGDMMEKIEIRWQIEKDKQAKIAKVKADKELLSKGDVVPALPKEGEVNKNAGFF